MPQFTVLITLSIYLIILLSQLYVSAVDDHRSPVILRPPHSGSNRHTMFLPLFPSPPNSSRSSGDTSSRRHLVSRSNARMALHDDLLLNGYYTSRLWIGSPPQRFALIVDTGSTVTYVPCSTCQHCGNISPYYNVELKELHVAGKRLPLRSSVFDGKHGTILDSGTTYAYLPEAAFVAFKLAIMKELHGVRQIKGPDPSYNDICFSGAGSDVSQLSKTFPSVEMVFGRGQKLTLSPENYLFRHSKVSGAYCLGVFQNGKDPTTLLGGIIVRNTFVMYDREHKKIGFLKTNCTDIWETLHVSGGPPQSSSPPDKSNPTADVSPSSPPMTPLQYTPPGETEIGSIIFYMSVSLNDTNVKSQIAEIAPLIDLELHVNSSQVHLLNSTSDENDYVTEWSITPPESADFMSNATASNIISRIAEGDVHLPKLYGKYRLYNWNIYPPAKRSWRHKYYVVGLALSMLALVVGLSGMGTWWFWRHNQRSNLQYKPVDSMVVPEQELQPL